MQHAIPGNSVEPTGAPPPISETQSSPGELQVPFSHKFRFYWGKIALLLLIFHSAFGLFESIKFLLVEYPELERLLETHQLSSHQLVNVVFTALVLFIATTINILTALRLRGSREAVARNIDLLIATAIVTGTFLLHWYLSAVLYILPQR